MRQKLQRTLDRLNARKALLDSLVKQCGGEACMTYHGGFDAGYVAGQISEIENWLDSLDHPDEKPAAVPPPPPSVPWQSHAIEFLRSQLNFAPHGSRDASVLFALIGTLKDELGTTQNSET